MTASVGTPTNTKNVVNGEISSDFEATDHDNNVGLARNNKVMGPTSPESPPTTTTGDRNTPESAGTYSPTQEEQGLIVAAEEPKGNFGPSDTEEPLGQPPTPAPKVTAQHRVPKNIRFCKLHNSRAHDHSDCNAVKAMQSQGREMPWELDANWVYPHKRPASPPSATTSTRALANQSGDARNHVACTPGPPPAPKSPVLPVFGPPLPAPHERRNNDKTPSPKEEVLENRDVRTNWRGKPVDAVATQRWVFFTKEQISPKTKDLAISSTTSDATATERDPDAHNTTSSDAETTRSGLCEPNSAHVDAVHPSLCASEIARPPGTRTASIAPPPIQPNGAKQVVVDIKASLGLPVHVDLSNINNESVVVAVEMVDGMTVQIKVSANQSITITKGVVA